LQRSIAYRLPWYAAAASPTSSARKRRAFRHSAANASRQLVASQVCDLAGKPWRCGQASANALAEYIVRRTVTCEPRDRDRYGRLVAACSIAGASISRWMVREGWAVAYRRYSQDFVADEAAARAAKRGIWRSAFVLPWEWRAQRRAGGGASVARPVSPPSPSSESHRSGCDIKGNINSKGERIYHVPGGRSYANTVIDPTRGERWFCSEAEAQAAGWRSATTVPPSAVEKDVSRDGEAAPFVEAVAATAPSARRRSSAQRAEGGA
jgi:Staphylococcal nuclease homologue